MPRTLDHLIARARAFPRSRLDPLLGLVVLAQGLLFVAPTEGPDVEKAVTVGVVVTTAVATALRRRAPITTGLAALGAVLAVSLVSRELADASSGCFIAVILCVFTMAYHAEGGRLAAALAAGVAIAVGSVALDSYDDTVGDYVIAPIIMVAAPALIGQMLRGRSKLTAALREKGELAERERARRAHEAVVGERSRIAEELHDVVAHALGAMTIQATAARRLIASDHERAADAFRAVETTGRDALTELRTLLGVLRREDEELALAPQPRLANLRDLVRRTSAAGLPVELTVEGDPPGDLPAGLDLTAYRLVQEALGEALASGAAGSARVKVRYGAADLDVEVSDDARLDAPRRLLGMHERVRVYGGNLQAGPDRAGGGHRVRARLPLEVTS